MHNDALPERFVSKPLSLNLATELQWYFVTGIIPYCLGQSLSTPSQEWGFGRDVVLEIRKSITEDGSSALVAGISRRLCTRGLRVELGDVGLRPFPAL